MILVPMTPDDPTDHGLTHEHLVRITTAAGAPVRAAITVQLDGDDLPARASRAQDLLRRLVGLNVPPGAYTLDDLLHEYVLATAGPAARRLADALGPVESRPQFLEQLSARITSAAKVRCSLRHGTRD